MWVPWEGMPSGDLSHSGWVKGYPWHARAQSRRTRCTTPGNTGVGNCTEEGLEGSEVFYTGRDGEAVRV